MVFFARTVVGDAPHTGSQHGVSGDNGAGVTERTEVLGRVETEGGRVAQRTGAPTLQRGAVRLGRVLDEQERVLVGKAA